MPRRKEAAMRKPHKPENPPDADLPAQILARRIDCRLTQMGWTMRTLSSRSGVPYETLKKIMNARIQNPSFKSVCLIALALECSLDELAEGTVCTPKDGEQGLAEGEG